MRARLSHRSPGVCDIEVEGEMDHGSYSGLAEFTEKNLLRSERMALIDMSKLEFMDSSALKYLYKLEQIFGRESIAIYRARDEIKRTLEIVGLGDRLTFLSDPDEVDRWRRPESRRQAA